MAEWNEAEYATVGALLLAPRELRQVRSWLRPEDFFTPVCGEVYGLIVRMVEAGTPVDPDHGARGAAEGRADPAGTAARRWS